MSRFIILGIMGLSLSGCVAGAVLGALAGTGSHDQPQTGKLVCEPAWPRPGSTGDWPKCHRE